MRDYYQEHLHDYDRPEQWTWREAVVEVGRHPSRAEARKKAEALLDRLRRGDDFAKVATEASEGPNRKDGGLWQTAPNSYAIESVNQAVRTLPPGQVSTILEGPTSYHIVRVESRRAAGPATFAEVQNEIRKAVRTKKTKVEADAFIDKLRRETVVHTIFDNTDYAPSLSREPARLPAR
jgi:parvulin-like peptidyl-prolyl isomerase